VRVGITGHQRLESPASWQWVELKLEEILRELAPPSVGVSSLAIGADQMFARLVLEHGGELHAILPFHGYEATFDDGRSRSEYLNLLRRATTVETLEACTTQEESYLAAGKRVIELSDLIVAVWDGKESAGLGGTGDAVQHARDAGKRIIHVNPIDHDVHLLA